MQFYEIEELLKTKQITQIPLRIALYVRVSTDSEEQISSLANQNAYYTEFVAGNPKWTLEEIYADEGITGMSVKKRAGFNRMITDAKAGRFDLIITKMVSRFARNTVDAIKFARELKKYHVGVWFHQDGILTFDKDSEFKLTLMAAMAQNESEKKSVSVKFGLQQAIKKGTVFGFDNMWGYRKRDGKLVIDEKEAPIVRTAFEMYATDRYSMKQIEDNLYELGYRNRKGNKINHVTLANIIRNPKYKGYFCGHKVMQTDIFEKRFVLLPEKEWVQFKDETIVPPIVDEALWEKANTVLTRRSKDVKNRQNLCNRPNLMTGKILCMHCNRIYHRKDSGYKRKNTVSTWICAGKIQNGAASCPARYLYEDEIKHILFDILKSTSGELEVYIKKYEAYVSKLLNSVDTTEKCSSIQSEIEKLKKKKAKLLAYNAEGEITDEEFLEMKKAIDAEQKELEKALMQLEDMALPQSAVQDRLKEVRLALRGLTEIENEDAIDDVFVRNFIDVIEVEVVDGAPHLTIKLMTGRAIEKTMSGLRAGHMTKRLVEQAERSMSNQQGQY